MHRRLLFALVVSAFVVATGCEDAASSDQAAQAKAAQMKKARKTKKKRKKRPVRTPDQMNPTISNGAANVLSHVVKTLDGKDVSLRDYEGKALLIVNTASQCGYTPQYADLQKLYGMYKDKGLEVLAFPSNDFGGQEPGEPAEIEEFVHSEYSVEFQMFEKVRAKGSAKADLYKDLTEATGEDIRGEIRWNFTKFLIDPKGNVVARFESKIRPTDPRVIDWVDTVVPGAL